MSTIDSGVAASSVTHTPIKSSSASSSTASSQMHTPTKHTNNTNSNNNNHQHHATVTQAVQTEPISDGDTTAALLAAAAASSSSTSASIGVVQCDDLEGPTSPSASSLTTHALVEAIGQLYKSKLSLSLRTVQLRRLMRDQFLSDLHHPQQSQSLDDAEIARWIASSALSQLEIEDEQGANPQTQQQQLLQEAAADDEKSGESDQTQQQQQQQHHQQENDVGGQSRPDTASSSPTASASPLDLSVRHTPHLAPRTPLNPPRHDSQVTAPVPFPTLSSPTPDRHHDEEASSAAPAAAPAAFSPSNSTSPIGTAISSPGSTTRPSSSHTHHINTQLDSAPSSHPATMRSATPIISDSDQNIGSLIGTSSSTNSKRGTGAPPIPIRRSSTSDPPRGSMAAAAATAAAANPPQWLSKTRTQGMITNLNTNSTSPTMSASLPPSGRNSPQMQLPHAANVVPPNQTTLPLTAYALVERAVSHPSSPLPSNPPLNSSSSSSSHTSSTTSLSNVATPNMSRAVSDMRPRPSSRENSSANTPARRHSRVYFTLAPLVTEALHRCWEWDFDFWEYVNLVPDTPLTTITCYLVERWGLFNTFNIDRATFHRFISMIESGYLDNAYHSGKHAADVVQNIHVLLLGFKQSPSEDAAGALCTYLSPLDVLASIIAAACHDYKHTGTTNLFHIATMSDLAIRYNDVSVLENMHLSETFALIARHPECDIFASLTRDQRRELRETIIQMILATDMTKHISMLTDLQATIEQKRSKGIWFDASSRTDRLLLLKNCLHLSDVANPTKPTVSCVKWADAIVAEWFAQGDLERSLKIDVSPMMDRTNCNVPKSQIGFIDYFIDPLVRCWCNISPGASILLANMESNRAYWQQRLASATPPSTSSTAAPSSAGSATSSTPGNHTPSTHPRSIPPTTPNPSST